MDCGDRSGKRPSRRCGTGVRQISQPTGSAVVRTAVRPVAEARLGPDPVGDLGLVPGGLLVGHALAPVGLPGAEVELQAAVVAVARVDGPVATRLAVGDAAPVPDQVLTVLLHRHGIHVGTQLAGLPPVVRPVLAPVPAHAVAAPPEPTA